MAKSRRVVLVGVLLSAAGALAACADGPTAPTGTLARPAFGVNSGGVNRGGANGGGGGGGKIVVPPPPAPTVNVTGTWTTAVDATVPGFARTVILSVTQGANGALVGSISNWQIPGTVEPVTGRVSANNVSILIGKVCGSCTQAAVYTGSVAPDGSSMAGQLYSVTSTTGVFQKQ